MPQANNNPFRKASKSGAEAFAGVDGLTINGGEHTVVGGIKMVINGDYDPKEIQKVRQAAMQDSSTIRTSSILRGAKGGVIDGDTESIAGGSITITGGRGSAAVGPSTRTAQTVQYETQQTTAHVGLNSYHQSTTRRKITATVGSKAQNLTVARGAVLSANAGSRVVGGSLSDVLAILNKAKEFEELDRDREAEILKDSVGANIEGVARAIAGVEVILDQELDAWNNMQETGQSRVTDRES